MLNPPSKSVERRLEQQKAKPNWTPEPWIDSGSHRFTVDSEVEVIDPPGDEGEHNDGYTIAHFYGPNKKAMFNVPLSPSTSLPESATPLRYGNW